MLGVDPLDIPQDRVAPRSVLLGLWDVDPRLTLCHIRGNKWWLLRHVPEKIDRMAAAQMVAQWQAKIREGRRIGAEGFARMKQAKLGLLGYRTVEIYQFQGAPDHRIVDDIRHAQYAMQNTREQDLLSADERRQDERRAKALDDAASLDRAKDAHRFMTSLSFGAAAESVRASQPQRPRSGFVRHTPSPTV